MFGVAAVIDPPTVDEWKVLRGLEIASRLHGNPTLSEIALAMVPPSNTTTVHRVLQRLALKGWVQYLRYRARGVRLLHPVPDEEPKP